MATTESQSRTAASLAKLGFAAIIERLYQPISEPMLRVRSRYQQELSSDDPGVGKLLKSIEHYSGKQLRPALLLLSAKACGCISDDHVELAVVAELIHTATLVHDDILDQAEVRRQHPSINHLAGTEVSVLLGDHLFSHALELALQLEDTRGAHRFSRAVSRTCLGEITQVCNRGRSDLEIETYYKILRGKTAELYATCCEIGAIYAGAGERAESAMYRYGLNLGIAFQIMDDVLDLRGDESIVGKTLGTDLRGGKLTLPVIHYLQQCEASEREAFVQSMQNGVDNATRGVLALRLEEAGSLSYSEEEARRFIEEAKEGLEFLGDEPMRKFLERIADFVIRREL